LTAVTTPLKARFSTSSTVAVKQMPPRPTINEADITEAFLKGSGPGGQKIVNHPCSLSLLSPGVDCGQNKTSSAVQLKHLPTGIVVKSQHTRSRIQNRKHARLLLAEKLEEIEKGSESRRAVKAAVKKKKKASQVKKAKRKYRRIEESKGAAVAEEEKVETMEESRDSGSPAAG
jgi:protein subunit release factor B